MNTVQSKSKRLRPTAAGLCLVALLGLPAVDAVAQTRAALVRDVDTAALQPFRVQTTLQLVALNTQALVTTVPVGKRLVIEHISWSGANSGAAQIVFAALRAGQFGPVQHIFQIDPPHTAATVGFTLQDGSMPVRLYFEAGEEVWVSVSGNTTGPSFSTSITGSFVTP